MEKTIILKLKSGKEITLKDEEIQEVYNELHQLVGKKEVEYIPYTPIRWNDITYGTDTTTGKISIKPHVTIT